MATTFEFEYVNSAGSGVPKLADMRQAARVAANHLDDELQFYCTTGQFEYSERLKMEAEIDSLYNFSDNPMEYDLTFSKVTDRVWRVSFQLDLNKCGGSHDS